MFHFSNTRQKSIDRMLVSLIILIFGLSMCVLSCSDNEVIYYEEIDGKTLRKGTSEQIKSAVEDIFYDGFDEEMKTVINEYFDDINENIEKYLNWYYGFFHGVEKKLANFVNIFSNTDVFSDREIENIIKGINKKLLPKQSLSYQLGVPILKRQKALNKKVKYILKKNELKISDRKNYKESKKTTLLKVYTNIYHNNNIIPSTDLNLEIMEPNLFSNYFFESDPSENIEQIFLVQTINFAYATENAQSEQGLNDFLIEGVTEEALKLGAKKLISAITSLPGPMGIIFDLSSDISFEKQDQQEAFISVMKNTVENTRDFYLNSL